MPIQITDGRSQERHDAKEQDEEHQSAPMLLVDIPQDEGQREQGRDAEKPQGYNGSIIHNILKTCYITIYCPLSTS